ncbi:electron transfer flavoprotein subunit alpha/FixB family protein [Haloplasma contractile]|uniref:Electron transfer flavoprotein alpha-subunit n=1 Tax=Haloplasma contractile SSD-17B TaxID=1033810 RepID=F7PU88_9MOLU|nr:electron transfer flavoprotein subunit alpha/FixB family protein [Haloplasma contractile]ERJ11726.1 Electron transfer flavoprotein alpha-subunit [Haloplasma contractile SSD-17B]
MSNISVNQKNITKDISKQLMELCPFNAFEYDNGVLSINAACKMCKLCVKKGPEGICSVLESKVTTINKDEWNGIAVYIEHKNGIAHPVSFELIGKAKELASVINQPVIAILIGKDVTDLANEVLTYGVDTVYVCEEKDLEQFNIELFTEVMEKFINEHKPNTILFGGTYLGRSFAPRVAARFKTGLTADCTVLEMKENTDLLQIRPAFGGNIMASIITENHRPQLATVRYKIFKKPEPVEPHGEIKYMNYNLNKKTTITILEQITKEQTVDLSEAELIVAVGRAFKKQEDLKMAEELAELLGAELACTRPIIENGWMDARKQIGLSGRTVSPKLIINLGISGSVQYVAGMKGSDCIISIDQDEDCSLFDVSHYAIVGDLYKILPTLINKVKTNKSLI